MELGEVIELLCGFDFTSVVSDPRHLVVRQWAVIQRSEVLLELEATLGTGEHDMNVGACQAEAIA